MTYPIVLSAVPQDDYSVLITYATGEVKKFNVKPYISGNWFGELLNIDIFKTVRPCGNTIEWE
ncbi:MAG: DUF2442 domain-containing protein [Clostridia bacterium]|nr:DUF2442 domain-containing protein [Clostridia bacterium]